MHDEEVACDGLLFNNIYYMPMTAIPDHDAAFIEYTFSQIALELELKDSSQEEIARI